MKGKRRFTNKQEKKICRQYIVDKLNTLELAKIWGCSSNTICDIIRRNGHKPRTPGESCKGRKAWNKDKTYEEMFGIEKANKMKRLIREHTKRTMNNPETKQRISIANSTPEAIQRSLKSGYGIKCYYKGEFFPSKFEKNGFIKLRELGFEVMHNFLGRFDAKAKKGNFEAVMEFHMFVNKGKDMNGRTEEQYYNQRRKLLNKYGYKDLKLIVIKDLKEIENKLENKI